MDKEGNRNLIDSAVENLIGDRLKEIRAKNKIKPDNESLKLQKIPRKKRSAKPKAKIGKRNFVNKRKKKKK